MPRRGDKDGRKKWHIRAIVPGFCVPARVITNWSDGGWFNTPETHPAPRAARPGDILEYRRGYRLKDGIWRSNVESGVIWHMPRKRLGNAYRRK